MKSFNGYPLHPDDIIIGGPVPDRFLFDESVVSNEYELVCKEFCKPCFITAHQGIVNDDGDCPKCLKAFLRYIKALTRANENKELKACGINW